MKYNFETQSEKKYTGFVIFNIKISKNVLQTIDKSEKM